MGGGDAGVGLLKGSSAMGGAAAAAPMCLAPAGAAGGTPPPSLECLSHIPGPRGGGRTAALWRPWLPGPQQAPPEEAKKQKGSACGDGEGRKTGGGCPLSSFRHPVRLCWPRSRSFDYLYAEGEALLKHFPVQATISLYEDSEESGSDPEEEEEEAVGEQRQKASGATPVPQGSGHPGPIRGYSLA